MPATTSRHATLTQTYHERANLPNTSPLAAYLLRLIATKKTNLCVSADVTSSSELLRLAEEVGDSICLLKTHADIVQDFSHRTMNALSSIAKKKGFLIFEDRKFGDIGSTVQKQYTAGPLQIVRWANIINAHIFPGPSIITALASASVDAVTAYNTSVETSITGPHTECDHQSNQDPDEHEILEEASSEAGDEEDEETEDDEGESDEDVVNALQPERSMSDPSLSFPDRSGRKLSVVSVSTTISTKTESISPQPNAQQHNNSLPHLASPDSEQETNGDTSTNEAMAHLGTPPIARGLLLLAQMSSAGNLLNAEYTSQCLLEARKNPDFVMGFIAQRSLNTLPSDNFITMTPGVQIGATGDSLGQQYNTPEKVVRDAGTDIVIVGRGVYGASDRRQKAEEYRALSWKAYEARVGIGRAGRS